MPVFRPLVLLGLIAVLCRCLGAEEQNFWPVKVSQLDDWGRTESWQGAGPFLFLKPTAEAGQVSGFRPFFVKWTDAAHHTRKATSLYPLFDYRTDAETFYSWSIFQLINFSGPYGHAKPGRNLTGEPVGFDVWPFYFSRNTGDPRTSYHAVFPIAGTIKNRFGYDRISWFLFPFTAEFEKRNATTTTVPWPIIRVTRGAEQGFAIWPLFGWRERPDVFANHYVLWPLIWNNTRFPNEDAPAGTPPFHQVGFLPFYTRDQGPGLINENFVWPFFGYTDRSGPVKYHETRYLWPFFVQGRGADHYVNRWGPFYTHSVVKGVDKRWVMWPIFREANWTDDGIVAQRKTQVFYFLYWSLDQRSARNPNVAPAHKTHLWPLYSDWDNGAGRRQFQFLSPFEVFFPTNEKWRETWTPFFTLYRYDQRAPDSQRHDVLWGLVTWRREPDRREFHLGPLLSVESRTGRGRVAIGNGLLGFRRDAAQRWRFFWFDFPGKARQVPSAAR